MDESHERKRKRQGRSDREAETVSGKTERRDQQS